MREAIQAGGGIASRLTLWIVFASTFVAFVTTATQLYIEYDLDIRSIDDRFAEFRSSQMPILTNSVWILDDALIHTQLDGLSRLPDIETLSVIVNDKVKWTAGTSRSTHLRTERFPLVQRNRDKDVVIGILEATASLDNVYGRLWDKVLVALLSNAVKTLLIAAFALVLFQLTVTRHLYRLADYAQGIDLDRADAPDLRLERLRRDRPDVLDQLVDAVNTMRANLTHAFATTRRNEERIRRENQYLAELLRAESRKGENINAHYRLITETLCAALEVARAGIWRLDPSGRELVCLDIYTRSNTGHSTSRNWQVAQLPGYIAALNRDKIMAVRDIRTDPRCTDLIMAQNGDPAYTAIIDAAVQLDGRLGAILSVEDAGGPRIWTADEVNFVSAVAALLAAAMELRDKQEAQRELSNYRDQLEEMVATRTAELTHANVEINRTLAVLRNTQDELVEREKLASLGSVVAGVAHEVNTPIGVGVTAASSLKKATERVAQKLEAGELKKSDLVGFIDTAVRSADILETNLARAAELVRSFKQVAVDQSSEAVREIELGSYLNDVITSLRPELRKGGHVVEVTAGEPVLLETTPSALWQIISNLVINSMVHAYDPGQRGVLKISVERVGNTAVIVYRDNGKGMSSEVKRRIFEPFFTTKRGQGGSGLGLSIVYNLATKTLGGTIACNSSPGAGSEFTIVIPVREQERGAA